ncbi:hypothetical protein GCM10023085_53810 [Actinomadura viridis]|uniref:GNAT superfamily N-acetyltransferase n=1 Tax=Actinomadura viridis TaxID=58110 RepID=A0A931GNF4_9ACTN|nr:GNAT family N-acetyltransferase [Actinomadura viridis]MBG6086344.1 GNAT superfamily N-acetyltransferase [Actinomadura viridis]
MAELPLQVRDHDQTEMSAAVGVLARGMRDNPGHIAAFGPDPDRRRSALAAMFSALLGAVPTLERICAEQEGDIVGFAAIAPPGTCRVSLVQKMKIASSIAKVMPGALPRVLSWQGIWARHDPDEPHSHFGPIAVDAGRQGHGIGSRLMTEYTDRLDAAGHLAYLETDKPENVTFYQRFGFEITGEAAVLGNPNWFMSRKPATR